MADQSKKKILIVPPGLRQKYESFKDHYKVANGAPILILGPTGVGKTLFYEIYKDLFFEENTDLSTDKIIRANCAHFGNQNSDLNIARSELFGMDHDFKSNIKFKKTGLIKKAEGGVLFLEEIGELPIAVQAMLLTFIEDKKFIKVGGETEDSSDCRIIAATNNEGALRVDFKNRFFPFNLPPICERREDVLYYLYEKYPDLLSSLYTNEVLELLSYNWPGNVREIERVGFLMKRNLTTIHRVTRKAREDFEKSHKELFRKTEETYECLNHHKTRDIDLGGSDQHKHINLHNELEKIGADVKYLDSLSKSHGLSLQESYYHPDGRRFKIVETAPPKCEEISTDKYTIKIYERYEPFAKAYKGFNFICRLFLQNHLDNKNVLKDFTECNLAIRPRIDFEISNQKKLNDLRKKILLFLSGIELDNSEKLPIDDEGNIKFFQQLAKIHPNNRFLSSIITKDNNYNDNANQIKEEISSLTRKELLTEYYKKILELSKGNVLAASRRIDIPYSTFRDELKKYGIKK